MFFTSKTRERIDGELADLRRLYKEAIEVIKGERPFVVYTERGCGHSSISYAERKDGTTLCLDCYNKQFEVKENVNGSV